MLTIRMGDLEEAKELYQAYEIVSGMTLDTYELKYRLAKAEGASYETLIEILEELKIREMMAKYGKQIVIVLEGDYEKLDEFLGHHRNLEKQICYKIRL